MRILMAKIILSARVAMRVGSLSVETDEERGFIRKVIPELLDDPTMKVLAQDEGLAALIFVIGDLLVGIYSLASSELG